MNSHRVAASSSIVALLVVVAGIAACGSPSDDIASTSESQALTSCSVPTIDPMKSIMVIDGTVLGKSAFSLSSVVHQIIATSGATGQSAADFGNQLSASFQEKGDGNASWPHCNDHVNASGDDTINGFPIDCPRDENDLVSDSFPVAIVNRFDLAPKNGANCGQYRISFAAPEGDLEDHFWIFEAVLPNPTPSKGLAACAPVAEFWAGLTGQSSAVMASRLQTFFFTGLPGFEPVVSASHYGIGGGTNTGQIRTNTFDGGQSGSPWQLREFRLAKSCPTATTCKVIAEPSGVANNPYLGLFSAVGANGTLTPFQQSFVNTMHTLVGTDSVNGIALVNTPQYNAGQSNSQSDVNDYGSAQIDSAFASAIKAQLHTLDRDDLTVQNVLDRATTQSCGGCHQVSNGKALGGKGSPTWPSSNGFTQIDEASDLSPALKTVFIPHRLAVLTNFLKANCAAPDGSAAEPADDGTTLGGSMVGAPN